MEEIEGWSGRSRVPLYLVILSCERIYIVVPAVCRGHGGADD